MRASVLWLAAQRAPAWGEPARPGFPPEGETGKGASKFLAAAGDFRLVPECLEFWPPWLRILLCLSAVQSRLDAVAP